MKSKDLGFLFPARNVFHGDGEINIDAVSKFLADNKGNADVLKAVRAVVVNDDYVKDYLTNSETGKTLGHSLFDQRVNDAVKTYETKFQAEKLPTLLDAEIKKRYPEETAEAKANRELALKVKELEEKGHKSELRAQALELINDAKLPFAKIVDKLLGKDLESTAANIQAFKNIWDASITTEVEARLKSGGRQDLPGGGKDKSKTKLEDLKEKLEAARKAGKLVDVVSLKKQIGELERAAKE